MRKYIPRIVDKSIAEALTIFGAVIIEGARGVGKSTSAEHAAGSGIALDSSPEAAALAQTNPALVFEGKAPRLIDEWQLAPNVWNAVRHEVDRRGIPGQFILTGSATPADELTRHSGAGRFGRIRLRTLSLSEAGQSTAHVNFCDLFSKETEVEGIGGPDIRKQAEWMIKGGWPFVLNLEEKKASAYLRSYLEDTARVDVGNRTDRQRVKALLRALARNLCTETSIRNLMTEAQIAEESLDNDTGVSTPTIRKYLDSLARIFILDELPAWKTHIRSKVRQRVSPKWHFVDPSLAAAALGIDSARLLSEPKTLGFFFESLCIRDLRVYADALEGEVATYRDETGLEVDAIVELRDGKWAGFEVKLGGSSLIEEGARSLIKLRDKLPEQRRDELTSLNVLTAGHTSYTRADGVNVIALGHLAFNKKQE
ncbi:MAG: DUF4143 domain-containing protein [Kiritimatiellae bacterium]|nr:DUF4143 domain-containing protein [Kiritimatiellia bacterium]